MSDSHPLQWPPVDASLLGEVTSVVRNGTSIYDRSGVLLEVELELERRVGVAHAILTSSGTAALHSSYFALGIGLGDEVLVQGYTFFASAMPLFQLGAVPVIVDSGVSGGPDLAELERLLSARTKALVVTHMWGVALDVALYREFCDRHGLALVEDISHAFGAVDSEGKTVGSTADVAACSFQESKPIYAGEGGCLLTNRTDVRDRALLLGHFNKRSLNEIGPDAGLSVFGETGLGLKYRIHGAGAAMAKVALMKLDGATAQKRLNVARLSKAVARYKGVSNWPGLQGAEDRVSGYVFPFLVCPHSGISPEEVVELGRMLGVASLDQPTSTRSLSQFPIFHFPEVAFPQVEGGCVRRPTFMSEWFSQYALKVDVPHGTDATTTEDFHDAFEQLLDSIETRSLSVGFRGDDLTDASVQAALARAELDGVDQIVTGLILVAQGKVLLLTRQEDDFLGGVEELPGGGVDQGEDVIHALLREVYEETGVRPQDFHGIVSEFDYVNEWGARARQYNFIATADAGGKIELDPEEHSRYRWVDIGALSFADCTIEVRRSIQEGLGHLRLRHRRPVTGSG